MSGNFSNLQNLSQDFSELITIRKGDYNHHLTNGQFHLDRIIFREILFNLHSIAEHILTESLLIIEILLQVMKLVQFQKKNLRELSVCFLKLSC